MNRNDETLVYGIPQLFHERYYHPYSVRRKTTGNLGEIKPIYTSILVQPGDTISMSLRSFIKMTTSLFPSMDNICCDIYAFADDWQNLWTHTKEFWGEDQATPFEQLTEYTVPQFVIKPGDAVENHDIINDISVPMMAANKGSIPTITRTNDIEVERLSYNAYIDWYNSYMRDQNYIAKVPFSTGDEDITYTNLSQKKLLKAARLHDYFQGAPEPQKWGPEFLPIGTEAPVKGTGEALGLTNGTNDGAMINIAGSYGALAPSLMDLATTAGTANTGHTTEYTSWGNVVTGITEDGSKSGMITDLTNVIGATINALRLTAATQQIKEELMWYGARFEEIIFSQWGVGINPATMRIPEYLGGQRFWLNMDTVIQTSETSNTSPLGDSAGYSTTYNEQFLFTKSFTTWQVLMIVVVLRQDHTYAQGIANQFSKKRKFEFYWDKFAGIGAQPRKVKEICVNGTSNDEDTWNFAPAFREYRSEVDRATGLMQPGVQDTLANYTYTDEYTSIPNSGQSWIEEVPTYVDRTLVVPSTTTDQFIMDFEFDIKKTSIVHNYQLPGLDKL